MLLVVFLRNNVACKTYPPPHFHPALLTHKRRKRVLVFRCLIFMDELVFFFVNNLEVATPSSLRHMVWSLHFGIVCCLWLMLPRTELEFLNPTPTPSPHKDYPASQHAGCWSSESEFIVAWWADEESARSVLTYRLLCRSNEPAIPIYALRVKKSFNEKDDEIGNSIFLKGSFIKHNNNLGGLTPKT